MSCHQNVRLVARGQLVTDDNPLPVTINGIAGAVDSAPDAVTAFTYLDAGTADERIATAVHSSAALALSYTETFTYAGAPGAYRIASITRS